MDLFAMLLRLSEMMRDMMGLRRLPGHKNGCGSSNA
jgi:hypothetical protein